MGRATNSLGNGDWLAVQQQITGLDVILTPLKQAERAQRQEVETALAEWREGFEVAKIAESAWKDDARSRA